MLNHALTTPRTRYSREETKSVPMLVRGPRHPRDRPPSCLNDFWRMAQVCTNVVDEKRPMIQIYISNGGNKHIKHVHTPFACMLFLLDDFQFTRPEIPVPGPNTVASLHSISIETGHLGSVRVCALHCPLCNPRPACLVKSSPHDTFDGMSFASHEGIFAMHAHTGGLLATRPASMYDERIAVCLPISRGNDQQSSRLSAALQILCHL